MSARAKSGRDEPVQFKPPLKPHRGVFIGLCVAFAVWVGVLLALYLKTVYPMRHGSGATSAVSK
jgi:hypothetical protein